MWFVCNMSTLMLPWCDCMSTLAQTACSVALWYKGLAVGGLWFSLVSDTKTFAESHSWEENTGSAADFIWWEDRDLPFTFQLVGPLHFFAIRDCGFLGYQWEGEKSLSQYIYIYIYIPSSIKYHTYSIMIFDDIYGTPPYIPLIDSCTSTLTPGADERPGRGLHALRSLSGRCPSCESLAKPWPGKNVGKFGEMVD